MPHAAPQLAALVLAALGLIGCAAPGTAPGTASRSAPTPPLRPGEAAGPLDSGNAEASRPIRITPAQRVRAGQVLKDAGQLDAALNEFNRALSDNPRFVDAVLGVGSVQHARQQYRQARDTFAAAVSLDGMRYDARYYLGLMQQVLGETGEAIVQYRRALELNPDDPASHRDLASAYLQVGRPDLALPHAQTAVRLDHASQPAWSNLAATYSLLGRHREALDGYRTAAELGDLAAPVLLGLGDTHLRLDNVQRAVNTLNELVRRFPGAVSHERLAYALFRARHFRNAEAHYRQALSYDPEQAAALNGMGACLMTAYMQQKNSRDMRARREALKAWRRSVQIHPDQPQIIDLLARYDVPD